VIKAKLLIQYAELSHKSTIRG